MAECICQQADCIKCMYQDDGPREQVGPTVAELIAREFHATYEALAPMYAYETRAESAVPWEDVPDTNRWLMTSTVQTLLGRGVIVAGGAVAS